MTIQAAGFFLYRRVDGHRQWLLLRNRKRGDWGFPKGHAETGEDLLATARRECQEETGITAVQVHASVGSLSYAVPKGHKTVHYHLAETEADTVQLSREHDSFAWLTTAEVCARLPHAQLTQLFQACAADDASC